MRRFNLLYLIFVLVIFGLYYINKTYVQNRTSFFGFAENKETEINLNHPALINAIHVTTGQSVNKGDLLMEVNYVDLDQKIKAIDFDIQTIQLQKRERKMELENSILQLEAEKQEKIGELDTKIKTLQSEIDFNQSLLKDLKSIKVDTTLNHPNLAAIQALQKEKTLVVQPLDVQIANLQKELNLVEQPSVVDVQKLQTEKQFYKKEQEKLSIFAPTDGLIGTIHCKEGENISSFRTLISFYERNPTLVKGYVHESLILHVNVGDTLDIASSLHPAHTSVGIVVGLGSRIVEIPERLRKLPEIKNYGREVLIQIPSDNLFLQKEKVVLNLRNTENVPTQTLLPSWRGISTPSPTLQEQANRLQEQ